VRINGFDTKWGADDAVAVKDMGADAVLLPKVAHPADLDALAAITGDLAIWAMMETPRGMMNAGEIAAHPKLEGMVMGTGLVIVDGVYNAFKDDAGLKVECDQGRDMGFDGKTLIHPAQVAVTNEAFAPSAEEIDLAKRQIAAFEETEAAGQGVAVVDGRIVENLHVASAGEILAKAKAIDALAME